MSVLVTHVLRLWLATNPLCRAAQLMDSELLILFGSALRFSFFIFLVYGGSASLSELQVIHADTSTLTLLGPVSQLRDSHKHSDVELWNFIH